MLFSAVAVAGVLGLFELTLRMIGLRDSVPSGRIVARTIDRDIEFPFMVPDSRLFWRLDAGFQGDFLGHPVTVNSMGIRGPALLPSTDPRRMRILCFGDSITFGYGVGDQDTYSCVLTRLLGPDRAEVVNCGVTGYTSSRSWAGLIASAVNFNATSPCSALGGMT